MLNCIIGIRFMKQTLLCITIILTVFCFYACDSHEYQSPSTKVVQDYFSSIAVLGDQLSLGAGSHPEAVHDRQKAWELLTAQRTLKTDQLLSTVFKSLDIKQTPRNPQVLSFSTREYLGSIFWVVQHFLLGLNRLHLQSPALSWGYLVSSKLGYSGDQIYIAAHQGGKIEDMSRQIDRVFDAFNGHLPSKVLILFSGNELCARHPAFLDSSDHIKGSFSRALKYLVVNSKSAASQGTQVIVMSYIGLIELLADPGILEKEIYAHGEMTTCKDLLKGGYQPPTDKRKEEDLPQESLYFGQVFPQNPAQVCPTKYAQRLIAQSELGFFSGLDKQGKERKIQRSVEDQVSHLASKVRKIRKALEATVEETQQWSQQSFPNKKINFKYVSLEHVTFDKKDVAATCQHLSLEGQLKIAHAVLAGLQ